MLSGCFYKNERKKKYSLAFYESRKFTRFTEFVRTHNWVDSARISKGAKCTHIECYTTTKSSQVTHKLSFEFHFEPFLYQFSILPFKFETNAVYICLLDIFLLLPYSFSFSYSYTRISQSLTHYFVTIAYR